MVITLLGTKYLIVGNMNYRRLGGGVGVVRLNNEQMTSAFPDAIPNESSLIYAGRGATTASKH